jgi:Protein of unknown function (DUF3110)
LSQLDTLQGSCCATEASGPTNPQPLQTLRPFFKELDAELEERWAAHNERLNEEEVRSRLEDGWDYADDAYTPFPSSLPTTEFPSSRYAGGWPLASRSGASLGASAALGDLKQVYVILFGVGETETEGIYSLRALSRDDGLPQETIIAFEDLDDAQR